MVGLTLKHCLYNGTSLLKRAWILLYAGVAPGDTQRAGVGLDIALQVSANMLTPVSEKVASLHLQPGEGVRTVVCASAPNNSSECQMFLESLGRVLEVTPDGDFNTQ